MTARLRAGDAAVSVVLPLCPGINSRRLAGGRRTPGHYRYVATPGGARPILSADARRWREQAALLVSAAVRAAGWADPGTDLVVEIVQHGTTRDVDSGVKLTMDAIAAGLGLDDRRFRRVVLERERAGAPCVAVTVRPWRAAERGAA